MAQPRLADNKEFDFPNRVIESQTTLPFRGKVTGAVTVLGTPVDIIRVDSLKRIESNETVVVSGTHTGANNATVLTDSAATFVDNGIQVGDLVLNTTDGSEATITAVTQTSLAGTLAGGTDDDWDTGDAYTVTKQVREGARAECIRKFAILVTEDCYLRFDGDASSSNYDVELAAGDEYNEANIRVVIRVSMVNKGTSYPSARGICWGI